MASRFWVGGTGTWDASDTTHWASSSGGAGGQSVPGSGDTVTFDASSGAVVCTVNHASLNITSLTCGAMGGTLDFATNNNNITVGTVSLTGTGTRTINLGNGTWTITGTTGTVWDNATVTNETLNSNSGKVLLAATATNFRAFNGGLGKTYNEVEIANVSETWPNLVVFGGTTITTLTLTAVKWIQITSSATLTVTNSFTHAGPLLLASGSTSGGDGNLAVAGTVTLAKAMIYGIAKSGAGSITANDSYDLGDNTSVTINAPAGGGGIGGRMF